MAMTARQLRLQIADRLSTNGREASPERVARLARRAYEELGGSETLTPDTLDDWLKRESRRSSRTTVVDNTAIQELQKLMETKDLEIALLNEKLLATSEQYEMSMRMLSDGMDKRRLLITTALTTLAAAGTLLSLFSSLSADITNAAFGDLSFPKWQDVAVWTAIAIAAVAILFAANTIWKGVFRWMRRRKSTSRPSESLELATMRARAFVARHSPEAADLDAILAASRLRIISED